MALTWQMCKGCLLEGVSERDFTMRIKDMCFSTYQNPVLTVGHNAKKRKTSHSNWKGKATQGKSDRGSKRKVKSDIAPTSDPKEAMCFYCNTKGH
nr:hypothetical protein [Tanacetum cinerariifolium]